MAKILKVFTPEQMTTLMQNKIISDGVGLTNFNEGSRIRSIIEAVALVASTLGFDFLEALRNAIPIALYDGLNFTRNVATQATGSLRFYRLPVFTITYGGTDSSVELDITSTQLTLITSSTPADDLTLVFSSYATVDDLIAAIDGHSNYSAIVTSIANGSANSDTLFQYVDAEIVGTTNYLNNNNSIDVILSGLGTVFVPVNSMAAINNNIFATTASGTIAAGKTSVILTAESLESGTEFNIVANAIDTLNGKGVSTTPISGIEHIINDSAFSNGTDNETNDARAARFEIFVQGLNHGTKIGIKSAVLKIDGIKSVTVNSNDPQPGQNTIVADDGTGALTIDKIIEIQKVLDGDPNDINNYPGFRAAGIIINIEAPITVPTDVIVTVTRIGTISDATEITTFVQGAIENYINTRRLGDDVVLSEMVRVSKNAHPAIYDITITSPTNNVSIGLDSIPRTGSGTGASVTVNLITLNATP